MLGPLDSGAGSAPIPAWRSAVVRPRMAARSWREADPATGQIVCLRLTGQLCADTAQALLDAVGARVRAGVRLVSDADIRVVEDPAAEVATLLEEAAAGGGHVVLTGGSSPRRAMP